MGSMRRLGGAFLAGIGCLTLATITACAASESVLPKSAPTTPAPGAPVAVASAMVPAIKATPHASGAKSLRGSATQPPAASQGSRLPAPGNPAGSATVLAAGQAVDTSHPDHVVGDGTPASCTSAAVVAAVAAGGAITFSCGPAPVTITMTATATVASTSHQVVLDGGGKVTLSGGGKTQILSMNAGWQQQWPQLVVQNLVFTDAYSGTQQTAGGSVYGGGAIFDEGGQYDLSVSGTVMRDNMAREGGGGIFFVVNSGGGTLTIDSSTLQANTSGEFQNAPGIFDSVNGQDTQPVVVGSSVG